MIDIRLPNITGKTEKEQLEQIKSYLFQFAQQLNYALRTIDVKADEAKTKVEATTQQKDAVEQAQATFAEVKSLIIKSADIVNAYYEEISHRLDGEYVAESEFGTYKEETSATIEANSKEVQILFDNTQEIKTDMESINGALQTNADGTTILGSQAWCKIGVLGEEQSGFPIYGMEIGQVNHQGRSLMSKKFAQYRSDGVYLYDQNGIVVATINNYKLYITNLEVMDAKITHSLGMGGYDVIVSNGLGFKWRGR